MAAFYYDYSDFQTLNFVGAGTFITNKDGNLYGAEAEFTVLPIEGLTLRLNGGFVDTELSGRHQLGRRDSRSRHGPCPRMDVKRYGPI